MPDDLNNQAADTGTDQVTDTGENSQAGADQGTDKKPVTTDTGNEDAGTGEDKGGKADDKDPSKGTKDAKAPQDTQADDGQEPPSRKRLSKQDFIIGRQKAKLSKASKADEGNDKGETEDEASDDGIAPEDEEMISKVVAKRFAPIIDKSLADDDNKEINDFLAENADFKPYEAKVRRFMQHPTRRALPIKSIFYEVAGDDLIKIGAARQKAADIKAKDTQTGGGSNRANEGSKSVFDLTPEEFAAEQERIRHSR